MSEGGENIKDISQGWPEKHRILSKKNPCYIGNEKKKEKDKGNDETLGGY